MRGHCPLVWKPGRVRPLDLRSPGTVAGGRGRRRRTDGVRRLGGPGLHPAHGRARRCCPPGHRPLRVLHLTDIHMTPGQRRKQEWLRGLADLEPDLVVNTGDNLAHRDAVPVVTDALGALLDAARRLRLRLQRLLRRRPCATRCATCCPTTASGTSTSRSCRGPTSSARTSRPAGSTSPTGATSSRSATPRSRSPASTTRTCATTGSTWSPGRPTPSADVRLGVTHAPYLRVLDQFAADGYDAVIAGHTHGGQVCLPVVGALTTNCDLDNARAKGLHRHPGGLPRRRPGQHLAARLGRRRHQPVRPDPGRLPARGHPAHADPATVPPEPIGSRLRGSGKVARVADRSTYQPVRIGLWRSLVARLVRDEEAAGSNPVSPTLSESPRPPGTLVPAEYSRLGCPAYVGCLPLRPQSGNKTSMKYGRPPTARCTVPDTITRLGKELYRMNRRRPSSPPSAALSSSWASAAPAMAVSWGTIVVYESGVEQGRAYGTFYNKNYTSRPR